MRPGLYVATVRGVEGVTCWASNDADPVAGRPRFRFLSTVDVMGQRWHHETFVTDVRPLVVLDPESGDDLERLLVLVGQHGITPHTLRLLAAPTPAEPMGLGAVVRDARGVIWLRNEDSTACPWWAKEKGAIDSWPYIRSPEVLSEGWSE